MQNKHLPLSSLCSTQKGNEIQVSCNHWKSVRMNEIQLIKVWEFRVIIVLVVVLCFIECECRFGDPHGPVHNPPTSPRLHSAHNSFDILQVSDDGGQVLQEDYSHQGHIFTIWFRRPDQRQKQCQIMRIPPYSLIPQIANQDVLQLTIHDDNDITVCTGRSASPFSWIMVDLELCTKIVNVVFLICSHSVTYISKQMDCHSKIHSIFEKILVSGFDPLHHGCVAWTRMTLCEGYSQEFSWIAHQGLLWGK